jgi:5-hydroxyisourate hydrolase
LTVTALTTHVLDLAAGLPAADVGVRLYRRPGARAAGAEEMGAAPLLITEVRTDADGRARLVDPGQLSPGAYRLAFEIGAHFARAGGALAGTAPVEAPFLDVVVIDFQVADAERHHHVPLLVSPFGYSTYRGS